VPPSGTTSKKDRTTGNSPDDGREFAFAVLLRPRSPPAARVAVVSFMGRAAWAPHGMALFVGGGWDGWIGFAPAELWRTRLVVCLWYRLSVTI